MTEMPENWEVTDIILLSEKMTPVRVFSQVNWWVTAKGKWRLRIWCL